MYLLFKFLLFPTAALAISGGHPAQSSKKYPFSVTLTSPILCGGSIISLDPPWILTAAHCIENLIVRETEQDYSIAYGDKDFAQQSYAAAKKTVLHPLYTTSHQVRSADRTESVPYDIGLIQLASPLKSNSVVNRIPISIDSSLNNTWLLETIGMGYTGYEQSYSDVLQYAQCSILQQENKFNHSVILATSNASLCHGDSGSPLLYKNDKSEYALGGILNRILNAYDPDPGNASCPLHDSNLTQFINAFARPAYHMSWIMEVTGLSEAALTNSVTNDNDHRQDYFLNPISSATSLLWCRLKYDWVILLNMMVCFYLLN